MQPVRIEYRNSFIDILAGHFISLLISPGLIFANLIFLLLIYLTYLKASPVWGNGKLTWNNTYLLMISGFILFAGLLFFLGRLASLLFFNHSVRGYRILELSKQGLSDYSKEKPKLVNYSKSIRVTKFLGYYIILINGGEPPLDNFFFQSQKIIKGDPNKFFSILKRNVS